MCGLFNCIWKVNQSKKKNKTKKKHELCPLLTPRFVVRFLSEDEGDLLGLGGMDRDHPSDGGEDGGN